MKPPAGFRAYPGFVYSNSGGVALPWGWFRNRHNVTSVRFQGFRRGQFVTTALRVTIQSVSNARNPGGVTMLRFCRWPYRRGKIAGERLHELASRITLVGEADDRPALIDLAKPGIRGIRGQDTQSPIVNSRRQDTESLVVGTGEER